MKVQKLNKRPGLREINCVIRLRSDVFEGRTSTGSGLFSFFDGGFAQIFSQIASITVKKLRNTNFISSRHVKRENTSLPVDVRPSKTSLLKLPNDQGIEVEEDEEELAMVTPTFTKTDILRGPG